MKRKLFSFSASVITAIMLTACAAAPENKPASSAALSPTSEAVATAIPSTSNANWKLPPQYDFDEMIPLFSRETHTAGYAAARNLYAVRKGERWSLFNAANCNAFLEDLSESIPYLYGEQELSIGVDDTYDYQKLNALEEQINQELVAQQMPFTTMLGGHGGYGIQWILGDSQIYRSAIGVYTFSGTPIEQVYAPDLVGIQQGIWDDEYAGYLVDNSAPFAVADKNGTILTDFDYQDACMAGESLIAVKDAAGNWGYCDQSGALVIPCIYQPQMSLSIMNGTVEYPYADLSGMVVVKNQSGQKLVLDVYGNEIISAGQYEDLAPARDGCVWAKQNGLWGLLQVQDYTENNADIILPDGCIAPDVTLSRIDSLCTYTTADHWLVMRKGPGTNYEKMDNIPYGIIVWECGYSSNVPDWVVVYYSGIYGWVSDEYLATTIYSTSK